MSDDSIEAHVHVDTNDTIQEDGGAPRTKSGRHLIDLLDFQWKASLAATTVARNSDDHGPRHWRDVARVGLEIVKFTGISDELANYVFAFAAIHDTQRHNEFHDPEHGERAAVVMRRLTPPNSCFAGILEDRLDFALRHHDKGEIETEDELIGTCWDSDRLTIGRVGITPSVEYMSTEAVRENFDMFVKIADGIRLGDDMGWPEIATTYTHV